MTALQPLHTLLEQIGIERDAALATHQRLLLAQRGAQQQAEQLTAYRREYAQRFGGQFQRAGAVELMQCYQGFMARLDEAVVQQQHIATQAESRTDAARAELVQAEQRVAAVTKLIERRSAEAVQMQSRREQKETDELAARGAWLRNATTAAFGAC
ncbi:flagellar export protein FliJ [uncultured Methylibium sp.]|uniref:flagellar export protein FliJ n=1 Tax=uncultured Methylibium sp. TaxID=381093 RepID=UPI0025D9CEC4|nr:flagellar export protein FliJ [uncultured Methylibium sp.]